MFVQVAPFMQSFDNLGFTYSVAEDIFSNIKLGQIVEIELKSKRTFALVYKIFQTQDELEIYIGKKIKIIKPIISIHNQDIFLQEKYRELLIFLAKHYFAHIHHCLQLLLPKNTREKIMKNKIIFDKTGVYSYNYYNKNILTSHQNQAYQAIIKKEKPCLLFGLT